MIPLNQRDGQLICPEQAVACDGEYDVIVAGGGIAGVGAAIAAGRAGCRTLVVEDLSMLGGLATAGLVAIPMDYLSGIGKEMLDRLSAMDGHWHRNSDPEKHKLLLDRMVKEAGCEILFVTKVVDAIVQHGALAGLVVESKAGRRAILARRVIDCTGDGDAAFLAGCEYTYGCPDTGYTQGCSIEFRVGGVNWDTYLNCDLKRDDPSWIKLIEAALAKGDLPYPIDNHLNWMTHVPGRPQHCGQDEVSICFAHSRCCKPLDNRDLTRMYLEGREQCDILWRFVKRFIPGFEKCYLIDTGSLLGVRDSRRIVGEYVLTGMDVASRRKFDDVIAISWRGYDIHHPTGPGNVKWFKTEIDGRTRYVSTHPMGAFTSYWPPNNEPVCDYLGRTGEEAYQYDDAETMGYYDVPYRCLVPAKIDNLLVAGRCLSADFAGQSATRLIMCCNAMGEAAGTAAALSLKHNILPRRVDRLELQRTLLANGGSLALGTRTIPGLEA